MNDIIVIVIVIVILCIQVYIFRDTYNKIKLFKSVIPEVGLFKTVRVAVKDSEINKITVDDLLSSHERYCSGLVVVDDENVNSIEITLIDADAEQNYVLKNILSAINTYLLRNKGAVSDFNLIKDVVERNTDSVDEQINAQLPIPLYLGLMGTMLGIIVGLTFMPSVSDKDFENSISMLIGGVSIAMITSAFGLALTTINSGFLYKGAKAKVEELKNGFYTMIQTELLPVISQNATTGIATLQRNLLKFNEGFAINMNGFSTILGQIRLSLDGQVEMMDDLKKIDVAKLAGLNVDVLKELRKSSKEFEKFNTYLSQVNSFVDNAVILNHHISNQLERTHSIETIVSSIHENVGLNRQLMTVLQMDIDQIEARKQYMNSAVISVDDTIRKSLEELRFHTEEKIKAIQQITIKEEDFIGNLIRKDATNFDELKNLSKMRVSIEQMCETNKIQTEQINELVASQDVKIGKVVSEISLLVREMRRRDQEYSEAPVTHFPSKYLIYIIIIVILLFMGYYIHSSINSPEEHAIPVLVQPIDSL